MYVSHIGHVYDKIFNKVYIHFIVKLLTGSFVFVDQLKPSRRFLFLKIVPLEVLVLFRLSEINSRF